MALHLSSRAVRGQPNVVAVLTRDSLSQPVPPGGGVRLRASLQPAAVALADAAQPGETSERATAVTPRERARRWFVFYVICTFWMVLLEGVLRKWVAPQYSNIIFFIRDPFLLMAYLHAVRAGQAGMSHPLMLAGLTLGFFSLPLLALTVMVSGDPLRAIVGVYGWRAYFLYIPLPFLMMALFREEDVRRLVRHICLAIVISGVLAVLQFKSPMDSVLNRGISEDEGLQFKAAGLTGDKIRPSGLFTSSAGQGAFVSSVFGIILGIFLCDPKRRPVGRLLMFTAGAGVLSAVAVAGSRGLLLLVLLSLMAGAFLAVVGGNAAMRFKAITIPVLFLSGGVFLFPILFPDAVESMLIRFQQAAASESRDGSVVDSIANRLQGDFLNFIYVAPSIPVQGHGLGVGTNARRLLGDAEDLRGVYAEAEWTRHFFDLGLLLGSLYILFRVCLTGFVISRAWRAARVGEYMPFVMLGFLFRETLNGQLTGHGTVGGVTWLTLGLALTLSRLALERSGHKA